MMKMMVTVFVAVFGGGGGGSDIICGVNSNEISIAPLCPDTV